MPGHVFVTRGDLTQLRCDAWLLPTDVFFSVTESWRERVSEPVREPLGRLWRGETPPPSGWSHDGMRVIPLDVLPETEPQPYLVNVGGSQRTNIEWYLEGVRQFIKIAAERLPCEGPGRRSKRLLALPVIGIGRGGAHTIAGSLLRELLDTLQDAASTYDLDIALVTNTAPAFAAAQNARRQSRGGESWPDLSAALEKTAENLADHAASGRLVLFLGAGIGGGAGLPTWERLLEGLAQDAQMDDRERKALANLSILDRPRIIEARLSAQGKSLGQAVTDRLSCHHYSLAHSLLAALPVSEAVTTNYDCLFEAASAAAGRTAAVLPYESVVDRSRWLLKMHGCVKHPADIVLTREDYIRYSDRRAALAGIVQALLITRHMLFVGFSLADDNFQRIVDDVRKAVRGEGQVVIQPARFGTALLLRRDDLLEELWRNDLNLVGMANHDEATTPDAARQLEIFLDRVLAEATRGSSPLLDEAYDGVLTDDERAVRELLQGLQLRASAQLRRSPTWRPIAELLERLGGPRSQDGLRIRPSQSSERGPVSG